MSSTETFKILGLEVEVEKVHDRYRMSVRYPSGAVVSELVEDYKDMLWYLSILLNAWSQQQAGKDVLQ
jgi:hypothetical protein